jgi:hypothetical protein
MRAEPVAWGEIQGGLHLTHDEHPRELEGVPIGQVKPSIRDGDVEQVILGHRLREERPNNRGRR